MAFYRAEYESKALEDGELELEKGDLVYIQNPKKMFIDKDKKWAKGFSLRLGKEGEFPVSFATLIDSTSWSRYRANHNFEKHLE